MNKMCRTNTQGGRSMIEMLGVLAIIGVLSVGGIAGYSKAMIKFKINKTIDQISQISQNIQTLYARQKKYGNLNSRILYKANLAPRELFEGSGTEYIMTNAFGGDISVYSSGKISSGDEKAFTIQYRDLSEEACIELVTQDWGSDANSGLIAVGINTPVLDNAYLNCSGEIAGQNSFACPNGANVSVPMPVDIAVDGCGECHQNPYCNVTLKFY